MSIESVYHYVKINLFQLRYAATSFSALIAVTKSLVVINVSVFSPVNFQICCVDNLITCDIF